MASSSSPPKEQYFSVAPKTDCPHVEIIKQTEKLQIDISAPCLTCGNIGENWLCLVCSKVYCSRFVKEHMVKHNEDTEHAVVLSFADLSVWCYDCDSYITSPLLKGVLKAAELAKFDTNENKKKKENVEEKNLKVRRQGEISSSSSESEPISTPKSGCSGPASIASVASSDIASKEDDCVKGACAQTPPSRKPETMRLVDQIKGVIYGNCIGDAIGLLTEFMSKDTAKKTYGKSRLHFFGSTNLEYNMKVDDRHRSRWDVGDWTDDSDQMILILRTLLKFNGDFDEKYFAKKLKNWVYNGYKELGDIGGLGLGSTTSKVLNRVHFLEDPHHAAQIVWEGSGKFLAPNGGVMRTSILGTMQFYDLEKVIDNTKNACKVTHADPRCIASCVAVTVAIALMLQGKYIKNNGDHDVDEIMREAHECAQKELSEYKEHKDAFTKHMFAASLKELELDASQAIGYTLKCLGAGFWAFRQKDFREAIQMLTMEAGDADTNCAVAGALLGCKVGFNNLPESWVKGLLHRNWLESHIKSYLELLCLNF